jgi:adenosylcobyric acid synthase
LFLSIEPIYTLDRRRHHEKSRMADAKILLIAEMLHGGGYASIVGTWNLLPEDIRARIV